MTSATWKTMHRLGAVLAVALTVSACAGIPSTGPVEPGRSDLTQAEQLVQFSATGPPVGATQEQLVRGFLTAASSPNDNYSVAREYLTVEYADQWDPSFGVLIGEGSWPYRGDGDVAGMLSIPVIAEVQQSGRLLPSGAAGSTELRFEFELVGNEWRISSAPSGLILDQPTFLAIWSPHQLNFLGPENRLVPETRWFVSRTAIATEIVSGLLDGPSGDFEQIVHSAFPPGVTLTKGTVPVVDGLASVDLTGDGLEASQRQQEMLSQLQASLQSVPGINRVELLINGSAVGDATKPTTPRSTTVSGTKLAGATGGRFGIMTSDGVEPVTGVSGPVEDLHADAVALSRSKTVAAVRGKGGVSIVAEGVSAVIDTRPGLLPPSVDDDLWAWSVSAADPTAVRVATVEGANRVLEAPWLEDLDVRALRVSPGGSLVAALVNDGGKSYVLVGGVVRDNDGIPAALTPGAEIEMWANGEAIDFDWIDQQRFVTLTKQGNAGKITLGGPGSFATEQGSVADAVSISGGGNLAQLRVLTGGGDLFAPQGRSGWQRVASGVDLMAQRG